MRRKAATMKDIAQQLNLSVNAVSLALQDKPGVSQQTKERVWQAAKSLGYECKKSELAFVKERKTICVLLRQRFFRDFQFYGRVLLGIEEAAKKDGFDVMISSYETEEIPASIQEKRVAGIIAVGQMDDRFLGRLKTFDIPIVLADYQSSLYCMDCVMTDNYLGAYQVTVMLLRKGYTKVGFFGEREYTPSTRERFLGVQQALQEGLKLSDHKEALQYLERFSMCKSIESYVIAHDTDKIFEAFTKISETPEVLVCSNDEVAILLMQALQKHKIKVGQQIGVVGFDDIEAGRLVTPPLTTVHVNKKLMGQRAFERLKYCMENPQTLPEKISLSVMIVERESV